MIGSHHPVLVVVSVLIAMLASYTALQLAGRVAAASGWVRRAWLASGSVAMGVGIWSMHFVAMLAFQLPVPITYDVPVWLLSILIAVLASWLALFIASRKRVGHWTLAAGAVVMGAAIAAMHYTGMAAVRISGEIAYDHRLVALSIAIAMFCAFAALVLARHFREVRTRGRAWAMGASGVIMGFAIAGMHYTGMAAATFTLLPGQHVAHDANVVASRELAAAVVVGTMLILGLALLGSVLDSHLRRRDAEAVALRESRRAMATLLGNLQGMAYRCRADGMGANAEARTVEFVSDGALDLTGYAPHDLIDNRIARFSGLIHSADAAAVYQELQMALDEHRAFQVTYRLVTKAAEEKWVSEQGQGVFSSDGELVAVEGFITDITQRKALEEAFFTEKERTEVTLHSIGDAVISTDAVGSVTYLNTTAEQLTGWAAADAAGRALPEVFRIIDVKTRAAVENPGALAMRVGKRVDLPANCVLIRRDESEVPVEDSAAPIRAKDGRVTGAVIVFRDASAQRAWSMKMAHLAQYDVLTDLPNRTLLDDRINHAVAAALRTHTRFAVLFIDLDRFKHINDSLGHARGDAVLQSVAARLLACVRASDTVSRRGGDEFVVIMTDLERAENAASSAEKILEALSQPHDIGGHVLHVTASVGISIYPDDAGDADTLISAADAAMYHAKQTEPSSWQFFTTQMNTRWGARRSLEQSLRDAVRRHEFILHFQPKVNLDTLTMTGVEALVRWQHPTCGLLAPAEFIGVAEECGLILPIGRWVLGEACRQTREWEADGLRPHPISVNVSAVEFRAKGFLPHVASVLRDTALGPQCLELEVTESALMTRAEATTGVLHALKDLGVQLAIDDFGTGYSSLSYLSRFPIDTLKIDRSFVHGIGRTQHDATIINAVIGIGRSLQQRVVAEGVETNEQLALLRASQCGQGQGYYFSPPVAAAQFADLLRRGLVATST